MQYSGKMRRMVTLSVTTSHTRANTSYTSPGVLVLMLLLFLSVLDVCGSDSWNSGNLAGGRCGWSSINTDTTLCCSGLVYVRAGINPACCGAVAYDTFYSYCCNGHIRRKSNNARCCGAHTYNTRSSMCMNGQIRARRRRPGSICCIRNNQRHCCSYGRGCCSAGSSSGNIEIPGFRPACCEIAGSSEKAQCCTRITQKTGVMPACCNTNQLRPTCCRTSQTSFMCCSATYSTPRCCRGNGHEGYYPHELPTTTPYQHQLVPVHPTPRPASGSCCFVQYPRASCCNALKSYHNNNYIGSSSTTKCCTQRYSCCTARDTSRRRRCCSHRTNGPTPFCCSNYNQRRNYVQIQTTTVSALPAQHRCYSCRLNNDYNRNAPILAYPLSTTSPGYGHVTQAEVKKWAPLTCCRSGYLQQCCRNAMRLAGVYAACCNSAVIADDYNTNNGYQSNTNRVPQREAACANRSYDTTYYMCCYGTVRRKLGTRPACCGANGFDAALEKCCSNGSVRRSCSTSSSQLKQWTSYYNKQ